ncbi:hypothetical protein FQP90_01010 [Paenarthrobacter nitroguajacolicus]|uniref:Uncharacterized protein n=1 Tax=Paenarthrobacter nitroguajacolicus TaxID=211146 RepID=A0A558HCE1_PAENT|nr:hypothetical protein [Paenarthrobacter nitroguajacolicus]TVU66754.1 hypothetical protein FQP90_01010 [Paenarthrobacter nitroguajacolicus]
MTEMRRFTEPGLIAARELLIQLRRGEPADIDALLTNEHNTVLMSDGIDYEVCSFDDREHAGQYFFKLLGPLTGKYPDLAADAGLWTWLSLKWLDILAPSDVSTGARTIRATERYVLNPRSYTTYYRHYLSGPYRIYKAHQDDLNSARAVLATPVTSPGEVVEQIASNQEIISNRTLMGVVTGLYVDPATRQLKRGSGSSGGGSPRRLAEVLAQFDQTWDTSAMTPAEIIGLLPQEFDKFKA